MYPPTSLTASEFTIILLSRSGPCLCHVIRNVSAYLTNNNRSLQSLPFHTKWCRFELLLLPTNNSSITVTNLIIPPSNLPAERPLTLEFQICAQLWEQVKQFHSIAFGERKGRCERERDGKMLCFVTPCRHVGSNKSRY